MADLASRRLPNRASISFVDCCLYSRNCMDPKRNDSARSSVNHRFYTGGGQHFVSFSAEIIAKYMIPVGVCKCLYLNSIELDSIMYRPVLLFFCPDTPPLQLNVFEVHRIMHVVRAKITATLFIFNINSRQLNRLQQFNSFLTLLLVLSHKLSDLLTIPWLNSLCSLICSSCTCHYISRTALAVWNILAQPNCNVQSGINCSRDFIRM